MSQTDELAEWLSSQLSRVPEGTGHPRVVLYHAESNDEVDEFEFAGGDPSEFAEVITVVASRDARGIGGASYAVKIDGVKSRFTLSYEGGGGREEQGRDGPEVGNSFDDPSMRSAWALALEHIRELKKGNLEELKVILGVMKSTIHELSENNRVLNKERASVIDQWSELREAAHERKIELDKIEKDEQRKDQALHMLAPIAKSLGAKLLGGGRGGGPPQAAVIAEQTITVADTITPEQLNEIVSTGTLKLRPEQIPALITLLQTLSETQGDEEAGGKQNGAAHGAEGVEAHG